MKHVIFILLLFTSFSSYAQYKDTLVHAAAFSASGNTTALELGTKYYTYMSYCSYIYVLYHDTTKSNDTLTIDVYFKVPSVGAGFQYYCHRTDTINIGTVSSSVKLIEVKMHSAYEDIDTIHNQFDKYIYLPLNIPEYSNTKEDIQLYPNPATNEVTVAYDASLASTASIRITPVLGGIPNNYPIDTEGASILIDLSSYSSGSYIVNLICDGNVVDNESLLVN